MSLIQKFNVTSLVILLLGSAGVGWWISDQIETQVLLRTGHTTSLFTGSVFAPSVESILRSGPSGEHDALESVLDESGLTDSIVAYKIWDDVGTVIHSSNRNEIGLRFEIDEGLERAWSGNVSAEITTLERREHAEQRRDAERLLEIYAPVRQAGTGQILAVLEFYQRVDDLEREIRAARWSSWLIVSALVAGIYLSLVLLVRGGSRTIVRQRDRLESQVQEYRGVVERNAALDRRLRVAAARTTALNEKYLRRVAAELHDGPAQEIGYALLNQTAGTADGATLQNLRSALDEIRTISAGLRSPDLENRTIEETVRRAVRAHNISSGQRVTATCVELPPRASLAAKITAYRVIREALTNARRHSRDENPAVVATAETGCIRVTVSDRGPGFSAGHYSDDNHLGLSVMRERVELLGGDLVVRSSRDAGTVVSALIPVQPNGDQDHA
jgi:signal transduction histidine kinase